MSILQRSLQATSVADSAGNSHTKMNASSTSARHEEQSLPRPRTKRKTSRTSILLFRIGTFAVVLSIVNYVGSLVHHGILPSGVTIVWSTGNSESTFRLGRVNRGPKGKRKAIHGKNFLPPPGKLSDIANYYQQHSKIEKGPAHRLAQAAAAKQQSMHELREKGPSQRLARDSSAHNLKVTVKQNKQAKVTGAALQHQKEVEKGEVHNITYFYKLSKENGHDKERLLKLLRNNAGILLLSQKSYDQLPTWKQVSSMYGNRPRLVGMESCQAFQANGDLADKFLAVAGAFNSGTNFLAKLLTTNCVLHKRQAKYGTRQRGVRWQVPYGKHTPPLDEEFRNSHTAQKSDGVNATQVLPAVMIRDPFRWLQSMCSHHYTSRWPRVFPRGDPRYHCPNLFPSESEKIRLKELGVDPILEGSNTDLSAVFNSFNTSVGRVMKVFVGILPDKVTPSSDDPEEQITHKDDEATDNEDDKFQKRQTDKKAAASLTIEEFDRHHFPVLVKYSNFTREHLSLIHFYNEWYQEYLDLKDYPHVMVRMEDLLFFPDDVVPQICECAGGRLATTNSTTRGPHPVRVVAESAKAKHSTKFMEEGEEHTGYLDALIKYGKSDTRFRGMTPQDLQYAGRYLDKKIMELFGYDYPEKSSAASNSLIKL